MADWPKGLINPAYYQAQEYIRENVEFAVNTEMFPPSMTAPTNHSVTLINKFGNSITGPVVYLKPLGNGQAEVHVESNFHIEVGHNHPATYATPGNEAKGKYMVSQHRVH